MPLLLAIPIISGLVGLFAGSQVDNAVNHATTPVGGGIQQNSTTTPPWYVVVPLVIVGIIVAVMLFKGVFKKLKIL